MSYTKQTWANGDVITADRLNYMEDGIADGGDSDVFVINFEATKASADLTTYTVTSDKEFSEALDAYKAGKMILFKAKVQVASNPYSVWEEFASASLDPPDSFSFSATHIISIGSFNGVIAIRIDLNAWAGASGSDVKYGSN